MTQKTYNIIESVKKCSIYLFGGLCIILLTAWFTGSAAAQSLDGVIDTRIDNRINEKMNGEMLPILKSIQADLSFLVEASYSDYTSKLIKQVEKIKGDPGDIKVIDIEDVMQKWKTFPDSRKTDDLIMKYEVIKAWYSRNQK